MGSPPELITQEARFFLEPASSRHRQYEALRAFFVEGLPSAEAAKRFGYSPAAFRVLCHHFRRKRLGDFFQPVRRGPQHRPKKDAVRELVVAMRKQNLSIYDIEDALRQQGKALSATAIAEMLREEGFARLPRRKDEERPSRPRPERAAVADVRDFSLAPRAFSTHLGGLFLFLPHLVEMELDRMVAAAGYPGSRMIPAPQAMRSLLALKLMTKPRTSHVMDLVFDEGIALFAGLNVVPKTTYLSQYANTTERAMNLRLLAGWLESLSGAKLLDDGSFNLDFHAIPFFGGEELVERHYLSRRSRSQKSVLTFLAQHASSRVFCYANADLLKRDRADEVLRFTEFWKDHRGLWPGELVFDSKLTTYANLWALHQRGIRFVTLRRRSKLLLARALQLPPSAWQRIKLDVPHRRYQTPRIVEERVQIRDYHEELRQFLIRDLGHERPTILLTNDFTSKPRQLITRYAQRMIIENSLADAVNFFHLDALSSAVRLKVDFDVTLTVVASGLYRRLAQRLRGYEQAQAGQVFRHFLDTSADVRIGPDEVEVRLPKRAHTPLLIAAGMGDTATPIPWWGGRALRLVFG